MLQVAVQRVADLWPDARIEVLTDSPENLARYCPKASALPRTGCACWFRAHFFLGKYHGLLPKKLSRGLSAVKRAAGTRWPALLDALTALRFAIGDSHGRRVNWERVRASFANCDLMLFSGSGGFADSCRDWNLFALWIIQAARRGRVTVAMLGQGIGPLTDSLVLRRARKDLPNVSLIGLRGGKGSQSILESIGVKPSTIVTTGDEAIEIAHAAAAPKAGSALGVNLRIASYAGIGPNNIDEIRVPLREFASQRAISLVPLPITSHEYANDCRALGDLLGPLNGESDGGAHLDSPEKLFEQTARCRIVVTGAYHAAVFALAQGIPAVCMCSSPYYSAKFEGLKDLFGVGCTVVKLDQRGWQEELRSAVEGAWNSADDVRSSLLNAAANQIHRSQMAYRSLKELIESKSKRTTSQKLAEQQEGARLDPLKDHVVRTR